MTEAKKVPVILLYGGAAAIGMIGVTIVAWRGGINSFLGNEGYLMYLFPLVLAVVAGLVEKRRKAGVLGFREALKPIFGVMVLSVALQVLFAWILVKWIDPGFGRALVPAVLEKQIAVFRRNGVPEVDIERMVSDAKGLDPFSFGSMMVGLARNCIVGFIAAVGLSAVIGQRKI